ncbi:MAG: hypothetical protein ABW128_19965 [Rhizorhabdus sp.]
MAYPGGAPVTIVGGASTTSNSMAGTSANPIAVSSGDSAASKTDRSVSVTTTSQIAVPANAARKRILIQNQDAAINVFVNLGAAATTGIGSIRVGPGGFLDIEGSTQALNIIGSSANPTVTVWEF